MNPRNCYIKKCFILDQVAVFRAMNGMSVKRLAEEFGVCDRTMYHILSPGHPVQSKTVKRLSKALNIPISDFAIPVDHDIL